MNNGSQENNVEHMKMIQNVITRMATNSAHMKI